MVYSNHTMRLFNLVFSHLLFRQHVQAWVDHKVIIDCDYGFDDSYVIELKVNNISLGIVGQHG